MCCCIKADTGYSSSVNSEHILRISVHANSNSGHDFNFVNLHPGTDSQQQPQDPPQEYDDECELTNLNWLTELKNVGYIQLQEGPVDVPLTRFNKFLDELKM